MYGVFLSSFFFISANSVDTQSNSAASVNQCKPVAGLVNKL